MRHVATVLHALTVVVAGSGASMWVVRYASLEDLAFWLTAFVVWYFVLVGGFIAGLISRDR